MSLDLKTKPELLLVAEGSKGDVAAKVAELVAEAEKHEPVNLAYLALVKAEAEFAGFKTAMRTLNARAAEINKKLAAEDGLDAIIAEAREGRTADPGVFAGFGQLQAEHAAVLRCIERVGFYGLPLAEIAELHAHAEHESARAEALNAVAHERAQKLTEALAAAAEMEGVLHVDTRSGGVVSVLLGLAKMAAEDARKAREKARELEEKHSEMMTKMFLKRGN